MRTLKHLFMKCWYNIHERMRLAIFLEIFFVLCEDILHASVYTRTSIRSFKYVLSFKYGLIRSTIFRIKIKCQIKKKNKEGKTNFNSVYLYAIHIFIVYLIYLLIRRVSSTNWSSDIQGRECLKQIFCCCVCFFPMPQKIAQGKHTFDSV